MEIRWYQLETTNHTHQISNHTNIPSQVIVNLSDHLEFGHWDLFGIGFLDIGILPFVGPHYSPDDSPICSTTMLLDLVWAKPVLATMA